MDTEQEPLSATALKSKYDAWTDSFDELLKAFGEIDGSELSPGIEGSLMDLSELLHRIPYHLDVLYYYLEVAIEAEQRAAKREVAPKERLRVS